MRKETTVIYDTKRNAIHFMNEVIESPLDLWIALDTQLNLFKNIEKVLVAYGIANNCTSINELRTCGASKDYKVIYNATLKKEEPIRHKLVKYTVHNLHKVAFDYQDDTTFMINIINTKGVVDVVKTRDNNLVILINSEVFYNITPNVFTEDIKRIFNGNNFTFDVVDY